MSKKDNPAGLASRGCLPSVLPQTNWFQGPMFLHKEGTFNYTPLYYPLPENDENVRKTVTSCVVKSSPNFFVEHFSHISSYSRLLRVVALCLNWVKRFRSKTRIARDVLSVSDIEDSKICVVRLVQAPFHPLLNSPLMQQHSRFFDNSGDIRVGGRLSRISGSIEFKNPVILSQNSSFSALVIRKSNLLTGHGS